MWTTLKSGSSTGGRSRILNSKSQVPSNSSSSMSCPMSILTTNLSIVSRRSINLLPYSLGRGLSELLVLGWKPRQDVLYRSWYSPGVYIRGKSTNVSVSISVNGEPYEGAFKVKGEKCDIWIFENGYHGHSGSHGRVPRRIWEGAITCSSPMSDVKIKKSKSSKFVSSQPDIGYLISVSYLLKVKKPSQELLAKLLRRHT